MSSHFRASDPDSAQMFAEWAADERSRFWAAASHDLKQPLHALGMYAALLAKDPPASERHELLGHMNSCITSLMGLFDAILGVTSAENIHLQANPIGFPLQRVIDRVWVQLRPSAVEKGLDLRRVRTSVRIHADPAVVERILGNLLSNAIRYTDRGAVLVGVRRSADRQTCVLSVIDTGVGLASSDQRRIFDDFFQVNNPERSPAKGYGLGLATVQRLCSALGYEIVVRSTVGRGSLFGIRLPLDLGLGDIPTAEIEPHGSLGSDLNVLFVDDDDMVRDAMTRLLKEWGIHTVTCSTGDEVLSALTKSLDRHWHVLLDQRLAHHETGLQIADRIRRVVGDGPTITLITGEQDSGVEQGAARRGITVLRKPLKPVRLRALLQWRSAGPGVN